ncbi:MAG: aldehyde dehydrogenase family protein, partial [Janthinobacterium lividum]
MASASFRSIAADSGEPVGPEYHVDGPAEVAAACAAADAAFDIYRETGTAERATFLRRIATEIEALGDGLIVQAMLESGLPRARLEGERGR